MTDDRALARTTDPATSHEAAAAATPYVGDLKKGIVKVLRGVPSGLTASEIAEQLGLPRDSISPRMPALVKARMVRSIGARKPPGHRVASTVWVLAHPGRDAALAALEAL